MIRGLTIASVLLATAVEPTTMLGDGDLVRYAITQGGLFGVSLVLLWAFRKEFRRQLEDERARTAAADHRTDQVMQLVALTNAAMTKSAAWAEAQEKATHRLARAIEKLEDRR